MTKLKKKHWLSHCPSLFFTSKILPKGKTKMKNQAILWGVSIAKSQKKGKWLDCYICFQ
jgi:hypothetical protein